MVTPAVLAAFLGLAALLWLSVFGYALGLALLAWRRPATRTAPAGDLPPVAVVVPVRDEARFIAAKLADLRRTVYPAERLSVVVVDGGSTDGTVALVEAERATGAAVDLVRVPGARGKAEQLNAVLGRLPHDVVVVTDADTVLEPTCIGALIDALRHDPRTAIVGARVRPASRLLEERIHWWLLNGLWWLEGEALAAAGVSGVCFAMRQDAVRTLPADCEAEDIHLALHASAAGRAVRLCRGALATELRVPQSFGELLRFRRRRGSGYVRELLRVRPRRASRGWRALRLLRLFHFLVVPALAALLAGIALALCWTTAWHWSALVAGAFAGPALAALAASTTLGAERRNPWRLGIAAGRLAGLTWLSLVALPRAVAPTGD